MAGLGYMAPQQQPKPAQPSYTTTMGMPQGPQQQAQAQAQQQQQQPGYTPGNLASYLQQNAMTPQGNPLNTSPAPYGLPSYADFMKSQVGQSGQVPGMFQRPGDTAGPPGQEKSWWDPYDAGSWAGEEGRGAMKSYLENFAFPQAQFQQNAQQNAFTNWMAIQNLGGQQGMNAFNMGITGRQTGLQEWAAQQQAEQAGAQFGLDTNLAQWRYGAGGLEERNLNNQRYATDQERVRQEMIGNQQMAQIGGRGEQERLLQDLIGKQQSGQILSKGEQDRLTQALMGRQQSQQIGEKGTQERLTQDVVNKGMLAQQALANTGNLTVQQQRDLAEMQRLRGSTQSIGFGREQLGEQSRASKAQEALKATQLQNELMAARYAAFGRQQAPTAQWQRGWS